MADSKDWDESKHPRDDQGRFTRFGSIIVGKGEPPSKMLRDTIKRPDIEIGRSVGAKARNYKVMDLQTGDFFYFAEGTKLQNVEVFCGKGTKNVYQKSYKYANKHGGKPEEWQHVKAVGILDTPEGYLRAEVHWSQHSEYGKYDFFIKEWLD